MTTEDLEYRAARLREVLDSCESQCRHLLATRLKAEGEVIGLTAQLKMEQQRSSQLERALRELEAANIELVKDLETARAHVADLQDAAVEQAEARDRRED